MSKKILTVVGARPQFVKAAVVSREIRDRAGLDEVLVHTGQHYDDNMSDVFFRELEIPKPHHFLALGGGSHGAMTGRMLEGIERLILDEAPDAVMVYGDTNSTVAGAMAAVKLHVPVVHVEAGLRSFDRRMPEEINRIVTDHVSALLLCPTDGAVEHLKAEGITSGVRMVGDVMYDATLFAIERSKAASTVLADMGLVEGEYALCTIHRANNTVDADGLQAILSYVVEQAGGRPVVFPVHPRTRQLMEGQNLDLSGFRLTDPLGYFDLHRLLASCALVLTDSGGLQKEAYFHRKSCVTLRDATEWVETVDAGWNRLWTTPDFVSPRREIADYGDGHAARAAVDAIDDLLKG